jgi:hypothetical protein
VAGGNRQRLCIHKDDAKSTTVATESVLLTAIVDAFERRDVAVVDIPNAFIQTRIDKEDDMAIIRIRGESVDTLRECKTQGCEDIDSTMSQRYLWNDGILHSILQEV